MSSTQNLHFSTKFINTQGQRHFSINQGDNDTQLQLFGSRNKNKRTQASQNFRELDFSKD